MDDKNLSLHLVRTERVCHSPSTPFSPLSLEGGREGGREEGGRGGREGGKEGGRQARRGGWWEAGRELRKE